MALLLATAVRLFDLRGRGLLSSHALKVVESVLSVMVSSWSFAGASLDFDRCRMEIFDQNAPLANLFEERVMSGSMAWRILSSFGSIK